MLSMPRSTGVVVSPSNLNGEDLSLWNKIVRRAMSSVYAFRESLLRCFLILVIPVNSAVENVDQ